jgi:hypothetical protein
MLVKEYPETREIMWIAQKNGFEPYPTFPDIELVYDNVIDAFMRRLPPRKRGDFTKYLEGLRLLPNASLRDFTLLGYSGAKPPSDGFSIIHPFNNIDSCCELLLKVAGFRHIIKEPSSIQKGSQAKF